MNLNDLFGIPEPKREVILKEAPYGILDRAKDTAMGAVKGVIGRGQEHEGNIDAGNHANDLYKEFKRYVGQTIGPGKKTIEASVLKGFMNRYKLDASIVDVEDDALVTPYQVEQFIMKAARGSFKPQPTQQTQQQTQQGGGKPPAPANGSAGTDYGPSARLSPGDWKKLSDILRRG